MPNARVTVTLPSEVVQAIDREGVNRSRFVLKAITHELDRRRNEQLRQSLSHPHPESLEMAEVGFTAWVEGLSGDALDLIVPGVGEDVWCTADRGWAGAGDWLDPDDRGALHRALLESQEVIEDGLLVDAEEVLRKLQTP